MLFATLALSLAAAPPAQAPLDYDGRLKDHPALAALLAGARAEYEALRDLFGWVAPMRDAAEEGLRSL